MPPPRKRRRGEATAKDAPRHGAGVMGASTAFALSSHPSWRPGTDSITILEATEVAAAASGKSGGFLAADWFGKELASLAHLSTKMHRDLAEKFDGLTNWQFRPVETYQVSFDGRVSNKKPKTPPGVDWLESQFITKMQKLGNLSQTAQVTPKLFTEYLVKLAQNKGAELVIAKMDGIEFGIDRNAMVAVTALTNDGERLYYPCTDLVIAAGPWSGPLCEKILPRNSKPVKIVGERAHSIIIKTPTPLTAHAIFCRIYMQGRDEMADPEIYSRPDGTVYLCGYGQQYTIDLPETAATVVVDQEKIDALVEQAHSMSPNLRAGEIIARQACYLPISVNGNPLVGKVAEGIWVNTGHTCWGMTLGPGSGVVLAEMMLEGKARSAEFVVRRL